MERDHRISLPAGRRVPEKYASGMMSVAVFRAREVNSTVFYRLMNVKQSTIEHLGGTRSEGGDDLVQRR